MTLTREQILSAADGRQITVAVPEWGGEVCVRTLSSIDRDRIESEVSGGKDSMVGFRARLVARTVCDPSGALLFQPSDIAALQAKSSAAMTRVFTAAMSINQITDADVAEAEKN